MSKVESIEDCRYILPSQQDGTSLEMRIENAGLFYHLEAYMVEVGKRVPIGHRRQSYSIDTRRFLVLMNTEKASGWNRPRKVVTIELQWEVPSKDQGQSSEQLYTSVRPTAAKAAEWLCGKGYTRRQRQHILAELREAITTELNQHFQSEA